MAPDPAPIRIVLAHRQRLYREALARWLEAEPDFHVDRVCGSPAEALDTAISGPAGLLLVDAELERGNAFPHRARERGYQGRIVVLTPGLEDAEATALIGAGVSGIFLTDGGPPELAACIRAVHGGRLWLERRHVTALLHARSAAGRNRLQKGLTERERSVLRRIVQGQANKEIAGALRVSEAAVKATVQRLFGKAGVRTRSQLVRVVVERYHGEL
jgi:DNA-binding NarL/FixJ family response regulator